MRLRMGFNVAQLAWAVVNWGDVAGVVVIYHIDVDVHFSAGRFDAMPLYCNFALLVISLQ
jgi:hypothetical protein